MSHINTVRTASFSSLITETVQGSAIGVTHLMLEYFSVGSRTTDYEKAI